MELFNLNGARTSPRSNIICYLIHYFLQNFGKYSVAAAKKGVGHRENEDCTALYFSIKGREGIK